MEKSIRMYDGKVFGFEVSDHAKERGYLDYRTLAHMLEDLILISEHEVYDPKSKKWIGTGVPAIEIYDGYRE